MSIYFSRFDLNTYRCTPYFQAHLPEGYPISQVLQKCRAFHRLPPNLRKLSALAKRWNIRVHGTRDSSLNMSDFYDDEGHELDPATGKRLTDAQIDAQWRDDDTSFKVKDIPLPPGGFADPDTWEEPPPAPEPERERPSDEQLRKDIASHGRERTAKEYGIPVEELPKVEGRD